MDIAQIKEQMSAVAKGYPKAAIAMAIVDNILNVAESVSKLAARMPKYKLPRIAKAARRHRKESIGMMALSMYLGAVRQRSLISQSIPKETVFQPGGIAIIGGTVEERQTKQI